MNGIPFSSAQIERFKRQAKSLCRTNLHLSHSAALDSIAIKNGYQNWSLLHKHCAGAGVSNIAQIKPIINAPWEFNRTPEEFKIALKKLPEGKSSLSQRDHARTLIDDISDKFVSADNAVDVAIVYMSNLLALPRYLIYPASRVYWEMRCWLPYCIHHTDNAGSDSAKNRILINREYKPLGQISRDWAEYEQYTSLHLMLTEEQLWGISMGSGLGYLYNDSTHPWSSRKNAERYLSKLKQLQAML